MTAPEMTDEEARTYQIEALVRRARALRAEQTSIAETIKAIEAKLDSLTEVGWKVVIDDIPASKKPGNRTFSMELAIAKMTPEEKLSCVSTGINASTVREIADAKGWTEACMLDPDETKTRLVLK